MGKRKGVLDGIKIADFSWAGVGPDTIKRLADYGAMVVHIESHVKLDTVRAMSPFKDDKPTIDGSALFASVNTSKLGVSLNLSKPKGIEVARKFILWADIVAESFTPGTMKDWGLDYESVSKIKPDIIYFSTCAYGQSGPYASLPGYGIQVGSIAGLYWISGWPDQSPSPPFGAYADFINPRFCSAAILAASDYRRRTGKGVYIDASQFEVSQHMIVPILLDYVVNGRVFGRCGNRLAYAVPHGCWRCKGDDCWVTIAVFTDEEWGDFCGVIGKPEWTRHPKFATLIARKQNEDELDSLIAEWTIKRTPEEIEPMMQQAGVAASKVATNQDLFEDPQLRHRSQFCYLAHPFLGRVALDAPSYVMSKTPHTMFSPPCLGQHNEYVYKEILQLSDDEIADCYAAGVFTTEADLPYVTAGV